MVNHNFETFRVTGDSQSFTPLGTLTGRPTDLSKVRHHVSPPWVPLGSFERCNSSVSTLRTLRFHRLQTFHRKMSLLSRCLPYESPDVFLEESEVDPSLWSFLDSLTIDLECIPIFFTDKGGRSDLSEL